MKVEVAVLGSRSLIVLNMVSVDVIPLPFFWGKTDLCESEVAELRVRLSLSLYTVQKGLAVR